MELIASSLLYTLSITFKILSHRPKIILQLLKLFIAAFLPCVISLLVMMFTFALEDKLKFTFLEKMLSMLVIASQVVCLVLVSNPRFLSAKQFIFYQIVLALNVLILAGKCIWFLTYQDDDKSVKDILLLALTTQIAFSIVFMQGIKESSKQKQKPSLVKEETDRIEKQFELTH